MASDLSNIIKSELSNTLDSLLSVSSSVSDVSLVSSSEIGAVQCIKVQSDFSFSSINTSWFFYIPTPTAAKFEYLMLGGIADLKDTIDDEMTDAVKEIISNISGSIVTVANAQGFEDITNMSSSLGSSGVVSCSDEDLTNMYKFTLVLNDEELFLYIAFDEIILPYISGISGGLDSVEAVNSEDSNTTAASVPTIGGSVLSSILGEESVENLRLLFDVKLRLSVRLGTKICLLRDVISWDIGEIIELSQMTNEPLDILVNGVVIGQGEAVVIDNKFGVKIKYIGEPKLD